MKQIFKLLVLLLIVTTLLYSGRGVWTTFFKPSTAYAVGDLTVNWGVPAGNPIFTVTNMAPGNTQSHTVTVSNGATTARPVGVRGLLTSENGSLSGTLNIVISQNGNDIYGGTSSTGPKTLSQFFTDSSIIDGMQLSVLNPNSTTSYLFKVTFKSQSGNEFQGKTVVFDLQIGISVPIPQQCKNIVFNHVIYGTQGSDRINAPSGNTLILGFEGNDVINGGSGNDCIIAGNGNNTIHGGSGNDVIIAGNGTNQLFGDSGNDVLIAGNGNSVANGGTGKNSCKAKTEINCQIKL